MVHSLSSEIQFALKASKEAIRGRNFHQLTQLPHLVNDESEINKLMISSFSCSKTKCTYRFKSDTHSICQKQEFKWTNNKQEQAQTLRTLNTKMGNN